MDFSKPREAKMYYNRTLSLVFSSLLEPGGSLRWLFDLVKSSSDLDFLVGKNADKEWISVYRGLSRMVSIEPVDDRSKILLYADNAYEKIAKQKSLDLFGIKPVTFNFQNELQTLINAINSCKKYDRYYNNKKEGYFQNELSRKYGIYGDAGTEFVIVDKEAVIGYKDDKERSKLLRPFQAKYKKLQKEISNSNPNRYGINLQKKAIGNELDFLALDRKGNVLLIEYKHGTNTSGIYLSPLQIGLYYDIFTYFDRNKLESAVFEMLAQKKKIGLINPQWKTPARIKQIIPVLIISCYNYNSSAKDKYNEVLKIIRQKLGNSFLGDIQTFNYTTSKGLLPW
jgi:hypothetical protein